jgi:hypothetical protein
VKATYRLLKQWSTDRWMDDKTKGKQTVIDEVLGFTEAPIASTPDLARTA